MNVQLNMASILSQLQQDTSQALEVQLGHTAHCMASPEQMFHEHLHPALSEGPEMKRAKHRARDFYSDHVKLIPDSS